MKTIFETCSPRAEVLSGELKEDIFAARLRDVIMGTADPVYGDPDTYFENTYPAYSGASGQHSGVIRPPNPAGFGHLVMCT